MPGLPHLPVGDAPTEPILLQALDPFLNPASPLLSILLLPSCYLSCHTAPRQVCPCPHGMALSDAAAQLRAWLSQSSPQDWVGWGGMGWGWLGMLDMNPVSRIRSLPAFLQCQTSSKPAAPGWDTGWEAQPSPLAHSCPSSIVFQGSAHKPDGPK